MPGPGSGSPFNKQEILEFLAKPVQGLDLGRRASFCLRHHFEPNFTVRDLVQKNEKDLLGGRIPNFGKISLIEVKEELARNGAHFGMDLSEFPLPEKAASEREGADAESPIQNQEAGSVLRIKSGPTESEVKDLLIACMSGMQPIPALHLEIDSSKLFALQLRTSNEQRPFAEALQTDGKVEAELSVGKMYLVYDLKTQKGIIQFRRP